MVCVQDVYCIPKSVDQSAWINRVLKIYFNFYTLAYSVLYKYLKLPCITDWVIWKIGISFFLSKSMVFYKCCSIMTFYLPLDIKCFFPIQKYKPTVTWWWEKILSKLHSYILHENHIISHIITININIGN